jgi:hypothetical protein
LNDNGFWSGCGTAIVAEILCTGMVVVVYLAVGSSHATTFVLAGGFLCLVAAGFSAFWLRRPGRRGEPGS